MNLLKDEKSLYLRRHASNPVDWHPWSEDTLERARREERPLILSIGYSACHWCRVMERESFEDPETARIMNENFVCVKVDREERPDLDSLYMKAVQTLTGQGGWPLTVFATPEGVPFFGGTYFPPEDRYGLPSFKKVLLAMADIYRNKRERVDETARGLREALEKLSACRAGSIGPGILDGAFENARVFFDPAFGGFGNRQKFPYSMFLAFLLLYWKRTGSADAAYILKKTLDGMAGGAMYDHIGGGFHRYTVDSSYEVPHFEKMLYDNAQLVRLYAMAFEEFRDPLYRKVTEETVEYLLREMRSEEGGFFASLDADTEEGEGAYYLWSAGEVRDLLGEGADLFMDYFSITEEGNCEGKNTLRVNGEIEDADPAAIEGMKKRLFEARLERKGPERDTKIITAWNGLLISAFCAASKALDRGDLLDHAAGCARFILERSRDSGGRLLRHYAGGGSPVKGRLEDHALLSTGLLSLHEATGEGFWLDGALDIASSIRRLFHEGDKRLFFDVGTDDEQTFLRERNLFDNDLPCGNSATADLFLKLFRLTGDRELGDLSRSILLSVEDLKEAPLTQGNFLYVLEQDLGGGRRVIFEDS